MYQKVFLGLFTSPVATFREIVDENLDKYKYWIIVILGIISAVMRSINTPMLGLQFPFFIQLAINITVSILAALIMIAFLSLSLRITGKWLNGTANRLQIENAITYTYVIIILSYLISILFFSMRSSDGFIKSFLISDLTGRLALLYGIQAAINVLLILYFFALMVIAVATVQEFSYGKAFVNLFLSLAIITIPMVLLVAIPYIIT